MIYFCDPQNTFPGIHFQLNVMDTRYREEPVPEVHYNKKCARINWKNLKALAHLVWKTPLMTLYNVAQVILFLTTNISFFLFSLSSFKACIWKNGVTQVSNENRLNLFGST